ncbi:MAG: fumarylacetoacetate hydrolase family protein [Desulfovibrionaceae bacterium]|nr:fumarylacetoacetate hydrolase family protein [Desulfovibrionaceae bacterium]MBF0513527.1 fumarylacetoacetate hydrolase family protein [Desulfovibrionaceae bacterium]
MRVVRVRYEGKLFYATLTGKEVLCLDRSLGFESPIALAEVMVLPPAQPSKIICSAVNYRAHAEEVGLPIPEEPVIFFKPPSSIIGPGQTIVMPAQSKRVDYEAELALVIGKAGRNIEIADAAAHIFGYCCANDVTARDLQVKDKQFGRAKGFDTFCPLGPWIETQVDDPSSLQVKAVINGQTRQDGNTSDMIFSPFELVSFISKVMTLLPGDVILTGTPPGVSPLAPGDEVHVDIPGVGLLINPVAQAVADPTSPLQ